MRRFLITLSGARPDVLDRCPTERAKFEGIGGAVLTTSTLAAISMTFALSSAVGLSIYAAVPAGVLWGLAIMSLDRWLVGSIQTDGPRRWRLAVPRIAMALLLGMVISTPLVLQIFKPEIDAQIVEIRQKSANDFADQQRKGKIGQQITQDRQNVAALQKTIDSGGDVPQDPSQDSVIKGLTAERDAQQSQVKQAYDAWQCQLYGGPNCPQKGNGVLAQNMEKAYGDAKNRLDSLNQQIDTRKNTLTAQDQSAKQSRVDQAKAALPKAQSDLDAAVGQEKYLQAQFDGQNKSSNGLLLRLKALNQVSGKDFTLNGARFLLFLLILLIECLPVAVKLMQKPGNYDKILALTQREEFRQAREGINQQIPGMRGGRPGSVRDIWAESRSESRTSEPAHTVPAAAATQPESAPTTHLETLDHTSMVDEALRDMPDTRVTSARELAPPSAERSGGFELFPDDDY